MSKLNTEDKQNLTDNFCNELLRKGIKPTVSLVLEKLPDSSRSTAHRYFKYWTDNQNIKKEALFKKLGFSSEYTSSLLNEINRFNNEAEQRYKEQAQDANDQQEQAIFDLEKSEKKFNNQAEMVNQQEKEIINLHTELAKEQKSNEATVFEIRGQLTIYIDDNKQLAIQNESLRAGITKAELKLESNQQYVDEIKSQNTYLTSENKELNSNVAELNKITARHESTIIGNDKLILNFEAEQEKTAKQISNLDSNNIKQQSEVASLRNELTTISTKLTEEKDKLVQQISLNGELKSNFEDQTRSHEKTLRSYETTITGNEKLIAQLEKIQKNQS